MTTKQQVKEFLESQVPAKSADLKHLHELIQRADASKTLSYSDGKNAEGKVVANPTIGYGSYKIRYADGSSKTSFRIGLSANATGISIYILGIADKNYLSDTYSKKLGKAKVTGYCIRFRSLKDIDVQTLEEAIRYGLQMEEK